MENLVHAKNLLASKIEEAKRFILSYMPEDCILDIKTEKDLQDVIAVATKRSANAAIHLRAWTL